jgi:hypothetical protein
MVTTSRQLPTNSFLEVSAITIVVQMITIIAIANQVMQLLLMKLTNSIFC